MYPLIFPIKTRIFRKKCPDKKRFKKNSLWQGTTSKGSLSFHFNSLDPRKWIKIHLSPVLLHQHVLTFKMKKNLRITLGSNTDFIYCYLLVQIWVHLRKQQYCIILWTFPAFCIFTWSAFTVYFSAHGVKSWWQLSCSCRAFQPPEDNKDEQEREDKKTQQNSSEQTHEI